MITTSMTKPLETVVGNTDLLRELLLRLPAKSLLRFKCVSKQWLFLISDPQFCHAHTLHHRSQCSAPSSLLLSTGYAASPHFKVVPLKLTNSEENPSSSSSSYSASSVNIPSLDYLNVPEVKILQSCNGLLLCSSGFINSYGDGHRFFVCNPATKDFVTLPCLPEQVAKASVSGKTAFTLAFDPWKSPTFKVVSVRFTFGVDDVTAGVCTYSSETDSWHDTGLVMTDFEGMGRPGVYCKGMVHWCGSSDATWSFDLARESLRSLPMPWSAEHPLERRGIWYFGESQGHLNMIVNPTKTAFEVLEIPDDYSRWSVKYHVELNLMDNAIPELRCRQSELNLRVCIVQEEKEQDPRVLVLVCLEGKLAALLDHKNQKFIKLCDLESCCKREGEKSYQFQVFPYLESLSCVSISSGKVFAERGFPSDVKSLNLSSVNCMHCLVDLQCFFCWLMFMFDIQLDRNCKKKYKAIYVEDTGVSFGSTACCFVGTMSTDTEALPEQYFVGSFDYLLCTS